MRHSYGFILAGMVLLLPACDGREESALENLANGANPAVVENTVKAEALSVMEPLAPPAPGTPGGLPITPTPVVERAIDPASAQGAAQVVQGYYGLLEEKRFEEAQDLWSENAPAGSEDAAAFATRFRGFSEIHANVGAPSEPEGAAGSLFVTVPVQVYARVAATGKPWYALRKVVLRRVNDVPGSSEADRRWHISSIGAYVAAETKLESAPAAISATDGIRRKQSP
ncbi:hypothetical protein WG908_12420 [Sphingobium sp. AN641]|uniref:hypothetical protein n=1 Tax=Sphingobium sp. AN641 TaxID=3133443 RepID=UPI0030BB4592